MFAAHNAPVRDPWHKVQSWSKEMDTQFMPGIQQVELIVKYLRKAQQQSSYSAATVQETQSLHSTIPPSQARVSAPSFVDPGSLSWMLFTL